MRKRIAGWVPVGLLLGLTPGAWGQAGGPPPVTAFVGVNVVPGDSPELKPNQTVLVRGGRIVEVGPAAKVKVPAGATRIEGAGKFLMPGIAEMHGHLPDERAPESQVERVMTLFVAAGVTTVRGMQGAANQLGLRDNIARGELLGPRLFLYGPPMTGNDLTPEAAAKRVEEQKKAGYDGAEDPGGIKPEVYEAIARDRPAPEDAVRPGTCPTRSAWSGRWRRGRPASTTWTGSWRRCWRRRGGCRPTRTWPRPSTG